MAYASSRTTPAIEDYAPEALKAKAEGFKAYKIHPGRGQHKSDPAIPAYIGHMEEIRQVRAAVGDEFMLAHDPVQLYNRYEAHEGWAACSTNSIMRGLRIRSARPIWTG